MIILMMIIMMIIIIILPPPPEGLRTLIDRVLDKSHFNRPSGKDLGERPSKPRELSTLLGLKKTLDTTSCTDSPKGACPGNN